MSRIAADYKKTYEYVFDYFSRQILSGQLKIGDRIPPERDIAADLGVSRNSVREVIHILEISGLIEGVQGSGNTIRCDPQTFMVRTINMMMALQEIRYTEIFDLRCAYEYTALRLAAEKISEEELKEMRDILEKMDRTEEAGEGARLDLQFHNRILYASGNRLLLMYTQMMGNLLDHFIEDFRAKILMNEENAARLRAAHWNIYHGLAAGDFDAGAAAMDEHFRIVREEMDRIIDQGDGAPVD